MFLQNVLSKSPLESHQLESCPFRVRLSEQSPRAVEMFLGWKEWPSASQESGFSSGHFISMAGLLCRLSCVGHVTKESGLVNFSLLPVLPQNTLSNSIYFVSVSLTTLGTSHEWVAQDLSFVTGLFSWAVSSRPSVLARVPERHLVLRLRTVCPGLYVRFACPSSVDTHGSLPPRAVVNHMLEHSGTRICWFSILWLSTQKWKSRIVWQFCAELSEEPRLFSMWRHRFPPPPAVPRVPISAQPPNTCFSGFRSHN